MKLVGLMIARNEEWVIRASITAAMQWVDELVIVDHASTDETPAMVRAAGLHYRPLIHSIRVDDPVWNEMSHRQVSLDAARNLGATHCAIIDADEVLTANLRPKVRDWFEWLEVGECLNLPMVPVWRDLRLQRTDRCTWTRAQLTIGFRDGPHLVWRPDPDGYQHHARAPRRFATHKYEQPDEGGVFHLQFADWERLKAKHAWYKAMEAVRWPGREVPSLIDAKYNAALDESSLETKPVQSGWWGREVNLIQLGTEPWHAAEVRRMARDNPAELCGLNLFGFDRCDR